MVDRVSTKLFVKGPRLKQTWVRPHIAGEVTCPPTDSINEVRASGRTGCGDGSTLFRAEVACDDELSVEKSSMALARECGQTIVHSADPRKR